MDYFTLAIQLMLLYLLTSALKIDRTFYYLKEAICFVYDDYSESKRHWRNSLDDLPVLLNPFRFPRHVIKGKYAEEFWAWKKAKEANK